jgi:hypothetical protein
VVDTRRADADGALALLREILADFSRLPGASCHGRHELFELVRVLEALPGIVTTLHCGEAIRIIGFARKHLVVLRRLSYRVALNS